LAALHDLSDRSGRDFWSFQFVKAGTSLGTSGLVTRYYAVINLSKHGVGQLHQVMAPLTKLKASTA
jgi:hypothetical protein